jgi:hypothetical protein
VPTLCSNSTFKTLCQQVPYITGNSRMLGSASAPDWTTAYPNNGFILRRSTALDIALLDENVPMSLGHLECLFGLPMVSVPLVHGPKYISMGFVFGYGLAADGAGEHDTGGGAIVAYLSDVSEVPSETMAFLKSLDRIDVLVIDMLLGPGQDHFSHFCMDQAIALSEELQPTRVFGVGMWCELEHNDTNKMLRALLAERHKEGRMLRVQTVEVAYDGLELDISPSIPSPISQSRL